MRWRKKNYARHVNKVVDGKQIREFRFSWKPVLICANWTPSFQMYVKEYLFVYSHISIVFSINGTSLKKYFSLSFPLPLSPLIIFIIFGSIHTKHRLQKKLFRWNRLNDDLFHTKQLADCAMKWILFTNNFTHNGDQHSTEKKIKLHNLFLDSFTEIIFI